MILTEVEKIFAANNMQSSKFFPLKNNKDVILSYDVASGSEITACSASVSGCFGHFYAEKTQQDVQKKTLQTSPDFPIFRRTPAGKTRDVSMFWSSACDIFQHR